MRVRLRCWKSTSKDNEYTAALGPKGRFACKEPTPLCYNKKPSSDGHVHSSTQRNRPLCVFDEFIPYGIPVTVGNTLHNADWMTLEESKEKYKSLEEKWEQNAK